MKSFVLLSSTILGASAYPFVLDHVNMEKRADFPEVGPLEARAALTPLQISQQELNCGPVPCPTFNAAEQYVSTSGNNKFIAPKSGVDIRGPCPGLNAAANHGYLNRNGIQTIQSTTIGLANAYGFAQDFAAALAVFSSVISGDIVTEQWSIGGPPSGIGVTYPNVGSVLSAPEGISYSHNKYEGDVSIGRNDAYLNHGDAHSLNVTRFQKAYETCLGSKGCTMDGFRQAFLANVYNSINTNPYYFSPFLAGTVVPPAAYNFVINFMSNHSAANPNGILTPANFMEFFAVTGKPGSFKWLPGQEKIPNNWYRRPSYNPYGATALVADDIIGWAARPESFRLGGNTNGVNTYKGVDLSLLTGGTYTNSNILKGNNAACLLFQSQQQILPDELKGSINDLQAATALFNQYIDPILAPLNCTPLAKYDGSAFNQYPGASYNPAPKGGSTL